MIFSQPLASAAALLAVQSASGAAAIAVDKVRRNESTIVKYTLPQDSSDPAVRATELDTTRAGWSYGPPVAGGPYYPSGELGVAAGAADLASLQADLAAEQALVTEDAAAAAAGEAAGKYNNLTTVKDYELLYDGEWLNALPKGPVPGVLTNYTQELLFSMERLSTSPYAIRRLIPGRDGMPFWVDDSVTLKVAGAPLWALLLEGRLFYADHSNQANLPRTDRYAPACDALFFIDKTSGNFLPLAIRTGVGQSTIYTPEDSDEDWLLAKIMYNVNDFWFAQWNHLAATHQVLQITWLAAIRALSVEHPIHALLDRLTFQSFAVQPLALSVLFESGGAVDRVFGFTGTAAQDYATLLYNSGSGDFQSNYFIKDLETRGLLNSKFGPALNHFPFYEDASVIYTATRTFMKSFVDSYYKSDSDVKADTELQAWAKEANGPAEAHDFPSTIATKDTVVDVLTHVAHLASTAHHAVNTNQLLSVSSTLPFHPPALYSPVPNTKGGDTDVVAFLPSFEQVVTQLSFAGLFARPLLVNTNRSLTHMFDDADMLAKMNPQTTAAAATFKSAMEAFSDRVSARGFDAQGLSQGMPFVWQGLDPRVVPYSVTI
ncbi:manganese lipoxygenase [Diaporthe amygdali]|uniref:manganese lipoxygenase n=1 Tax=Phomopsis amygdali TaxID=1214568 RepID=UPI0022FEE7A5|nr:manganese lipoxygenase [Diaporthe amygdali]KAJ0108602.1 manganese lipoxygenase [Diaporthe amygdali]